MKQSARQPRIAVVKKLLPWAWTLMFSLFSISFSHAGYSPDFRDARSITGVDKFLTETVKNERFRTGNASYYQLAERGHGDSKMSIEDRKRRSKEHWDKLSPEKKERLKQRQQRFEQLSPEERQRVIRAREHYRSMPKEKRQELREKWKNSSAEGGGKHRSKEGGKKHRRKKETDHERKN